MLYALPTLPTENTNSDCRNKGDTAAVHIRVYLNLGHKPATCTVCCTALSTPCERLDGTSYTLSRQTHNANNGKSIALLIYDTCIPGT